jgi:hypothetical protein
MAEESGGVPKYNGGSNVAVAAKSDGAKRKRHIAGRIIAKHWRMAMAMRAAARVRAVHNSGMALTLARSRAHGMASGSIALLPRNVTRGIGACALAIADNIAASISVTSRGEKQARRGTYRSWRTTSPAAQRSNGALARRLRCLAAAASHIARTRISAIAGMVALARGKRHQRQLGIGNSSISARKQRNVAWRQSKLWR